MVKKTAAMRARRYLNPEETAIFCEQIALILDSGIPLHDGIEALAGNYRNSAYAAYFNGMYERMNASGSFYEAVRDAGLFEPYLVSMVRIGEAAGKLDAVMKALADYYDGQSKTSRMIKNAVLYPAALILMMAVVVAVLVIQVLPVFDQVFQSLGSDLSAAGGGFMRFGMVAGRAVLVLAGVLLAAVLVGLILSKTAARAPFYRFLARVFPPVARVRKKIVAQRFAAVISMMLSSGYPLEQGLELAADITGDGPAREKIIQIRRQMGEKSFAEAVREAGLFDEIHNKMIAVGQMSGQTDSVMRRLAALYEEELAQSVSYLVSLIEPTLVAFVSVMVGAILLSVMLPLLGIMSSII